ncbi:protein phosphatase 1 regulatory subunit 1C isoform X3 [Mustela erminea]|uniref:protein phosphatase 1 regulatory subunit 1C isoform X3 n=1 Tax=Mustela erminea TaxID=36723 RepID=UPI0013869E68|nr:protein phosphatase 1 regulatory subunit 1C isoform X3 [Mustela erminea]
MGINSPLPEVAGWKTTCPTSARALPVPRAHTQIDDKKVTNTQAESQNASPKQRKQSVYTPPAMKGVKHLKGQSESAFPEEEEGVNEREEQWEH